ncbi:unnamed protein product [Auanema sp. JU1783]|nr:unnamed protein product [Auanema sp. JU1783]
MVYDYETARKVWESKVPIEFILDSDTQNSRPLYVMIPRISYFCLQLPKIISFFFGEQDERIDPDTVSLEYCSQPVKAYYPVGVLYDMYKAKSAEFWSITVRRNEKPLGTALRKDQMEQMYMQSVKEADFMKRKAEVIYSMRDEDHRQLWNGIVHYNFEEFWLVNKRLMLTSSDQSFLHIPLRLYESGKPFKQVPLKPTQESGEEATLSSALAQLYPNLDISTTEFFSHGISLPLNTPLTYLAENIAYPDNFVHVCAVPVES